MNGAQYDVKYYFGQRMRQLQDTMNDEFDTFCMQFASEGASESEKLKEQLHDVGQERDKVLERFKAEKKRWEQEKADYEQQIAALKDMLRWKQQTNGQIPSVYELLRQANIDLEYELEAAYYYADLEINKYQQTLTRISRAINPNADETSE